MEKLFSSLISINAVVALLFIVGYIFLFDKRSKTNRMLPVMLLGSGLWSLSNSVLIKNFDSLSSAKNCLFIEIVGIFLYVIAAQMLFLKYSNVLGLKRMLCTIIAWAGLLVAALAINPGWLENAYLNRFQNLVSFLKSKDISEVFLGYMVLAVLSVFIQILGMLKASQPAKVRIFGRKFLEILVLNIVGIFFDQLFPKYSYLGFPGGVLTQFWGMLIMWDAVKSLEDVHIDAKNLADKLSKIDGAPVLVYGGGGGGGLDPKDAEEERKKLQYANEAAQQYFNMNSQAPLENYSMNNLFEDVMNNYDRVADNVPDAYLAKRADKDEYCYLQVNDLKDRYNDSVASMVRINEIPNQEEARQTWENWQSARKEATQELETARTLTNEAKEARDTFNSLVDEAKHSRDTFNSLANEARQSINHSELLADEARQSIKKAEQFGEDARNTERYYRAKLNHEFDTTMNPLSAIWTPKNAADFSAPRYSAEAQLKENFSRERINEKLGKEISNPEIRNDFVSKEAPASAHFSEGNARPAPAPADFIDGVRKHTPVPSDFTESVSKPTPAYSFEGTTRDKANLDGSFVRGTRALIASQNETERNALAQILQSYGIKVDTASNARDTMKMCRDKNYTLLFMDENLPAMNGAKTLGKIRGINDFYQDTCKILALSGATPEAHKNGTVSPSFDGYIEGPAKDVNVQMLLNYFLPKDKFSEGTSFSDLKGPEVTVSKNIDDLRASFQASKAKKSIETPQTEKPFLENTVSTVNVDSPVSSINEVEDIEASPAFGEVSHFVGNDVDSIDIPSADELFKTQEAENEDPAPAKVSPLENSKPSSKFEELLNEERSKKVTKEHPSINDDYEDDDDLEDEDMEIASEEDLEDKNIERKNFDKDKKTKKAKKDAIENKKNKEKINSEGKEDPENPEKEGDKVDYDNLRDFKKIIPEVQREKASKDNEKSDLQPVKKHKK